MHPTTWLRYVWMWTQLLCHGIVPQWLRQSGDVVLCTKQWKADGQPSSGLPQVREPRVMGVFPVLLGNGPSMSIKYNRKSAKTPKDLHKDSHEDQKSISLEIFYTLLPPVKIHNLGIVKSDSIAEKGEAQKHYSSEKQFIWHFLSKDLKGKFCPYWHCTQQMTNSYHRDDVLRKTNIVSHLTYSTNI